MGVPLGCLTVTPRLWLVRHGESEWNRRGLVQGHASDPKLTDRGINQARAVLGRLDTRSVGALYSSDLLRAVQTAEILGSALGTQIRVEAALRERSFGVAEGLPLTELGADSGVEADRVVDPDRAPVGGESVRRLYERAVGFATEALQRHPGDDLVFVTHGGVIRVLRAWCARIGPDEMSWGAVENGAVFEEVAPVVCATTGRSGW